MTDTPKRRKTSSPRLNKQKREELERSKKRLLEAAMNPYMETLQGGGITLEKLAKKLAEELEATTWKGFAHEGSIIDERDLVDWRTRQAARIDAQKLLGLYPAEKAEVDVKGNIHVNIHLGGKKDE